MKQGVSFSGTYSLDGQWSLTATQTSINGGWANTRSRFARSQDTGTASGTRVFALIANNPVTLNRYLDLVFWPG